MSEIEKIREALSFGARTGDLELMQAVYQLEPEGPEITVDDGPKVVPRDCARCQQSYLVSTRHAKSVPAESLFNLCEACLDQIAAVPLEEPLSPADSEMVRCMMDECVVTRLILPTTWNRTRSRMWTLA